MSGVRIGTILIRHRLNEARAIVQALLECWPDTHMPPGPLCVRAANFVNSLEAQTPSEGMRAEVARIIDALPFDDGWVGMLMTRLYRKEEALAKADAILALLSKAPSNG